MNFFANDVEFEAATIPDNMSSLYSRWVPPKKSKVPAETRLSPEPQPSPVVAAPPSALYASTPYARYVPPKKNKTQTLPRQPSPPPLITAQPEDEEATPKKRRKLKTADEEQPKKEKKDKKKSKSREIESIQALAAQTNDVETGIETPLLNGSTPEVEVDPETRDMVVGNSEEMEVELDNDAKEAIFAKYRIAMKKSVQVETAIKVKKAKKGIRTPTPEPELHGKSHFAIIHRLREQFPKQCRQFCNAFTEICTLASQYWSQLMQGGHSKDFASPNH